MEGLAPPLKLLLEVRFAIDNGETVRSGILRYVRKNQDPFCQVVQRWIFAHDQGQTVSESVLKSINLYRRSLLDILSNGLRGHPVRKQLDEFEIELQQACESQIDEFINLLPIKILMPLVLLQFPAFLLLLLGPLFMELMKGLNS